MTGSKSYVRHPQAKSTQSHAPNSKKRTHDGITKTAGPEKQKQQHSQPSQSQPIIPFTPHTRILLIGEGDFSFAASLVQHHGCADILASSFEPDREALLAKYPHAAARLQEIEDAFEHEEDGGKWRVQFGVDARRLQACKEVRRRKWDRVWFNFPHAGGRSKDVNRQVRFNQELLSEFFESAANVLRSGEDHQSYFGDDENDDDGENDDDDESRSSIIITVFEGEPYTLWNVRDLARNKGLVVRRSWKFDPGVYPGYRHARTAGVIKKGGADGEEESETAWRGEDRAARTYEFGLKDDIPNQKPVTSGSANSKKRKHKPPSDSDSD